MIKKFTIKKSSFSLIHLNEKISFIATKSSKIKKLIENKVKKSIEDKVKKFDIINESDKAESSKIKELIKNKTQKPEKVKKLKGKKSKIIEKLEPKRFHQNMQSAGICNVGVTDI